MYESTEDIAVLQGLLDRSIEQAGSFLRESLQIESHTLSADQVVRHLDGIRHASLATVTARGQPRVAPIVAIFVRGKYYVPTVVSAARTCHLRQRPGVSLTEYKGSDDAIIIHGRATLIGLSHTDFDEIDEKYMTFTTSGGPRNWGGDGPVYIRVDPDVMYATSFDSPG